MEEKENEKFSVDTEDLKNETKETVNKVKESIKNVNFKEDAEATKGFIKKMFVNPIDEIKKVAAGEENVLSKVIFILIVSVVISLVTRIVYTLSYGSMTQFFTKIMSFVRAITNPIFRVLILALLIYVFNKKNKKSLITVISTVVIASIPSVISSALSLVSTIIEEVSIVTSPLIAGCAVATMILTYFGMKTLFNEEDDNVMIKKFVVIRVITSLAMIVLVRLSLA